MDPIIDAFTGVVDSFVDAQAFGGHTWGQVLLVAFVVILGLFILKFAFSTPARSPRRDLLALGQCPGCGWEGRISRYRNSCPRCREEVEFR